MNTIIIPSLINNSAIPFKEHLELENNERILFSGKFGKGKTTFLKEVFENQIKYFNEDVYEAVFLDPVNYSVASTEDIFGYIKYDILLTMLEKQKELGAIEFTNKEAVQYYVWQHPEEIAKQLLKYIPKIGKILDAIVPGIEKLVNNIKEFKKRVNDETEESKVLKFIDSIEKGAFSIYENDIITFLIRKMLSQKEKTKQSVLIVDNIDRIDPEHLFRILNIFSSQMDHKQDNTIINKFHFDKVILVCDIENVRNIFSNRYGTNVDFAGYIDKFYSSRIFHFQNYEQIKSICHNLIRNLGIGYSKDSVNTLPNLSNHGLFNLVTVLVLANRLSLRKVFTFVKDSFIINDFDFLVNGRNRRFSPWDTPILEMAILSGIVGGYKQLKEDIEFMMHLANGFSNLDHWFSKLLFFEARHKHDYSRGNHTFVYDNPRKQLVIYITIGKNNYEYESLEIKYVSKPGDPTIGEIDYQLDPIDYYELYLKILKEFHATKVIE